MDKIHAQTSAIMQKITPVSPMGIPFIHATKPTPIPYVVTSSLHYAPAPPARCSVKVTCSVKFALECVSPDVLHKGEGFTISVYHVQSESFNCQG